MVYVYPCPDNENVSFQCLTAFLCFRWRGDRWCR